jgi:hypothetical protein
MYKAVWAPKTGIHDLRSEDVANQTRYRAILNGEEGLSKSTYCRVNVYWEMSLAASKRFPPYLSKL